MAGLSFVQGAEIVALSASAHRSPLFHGCGCPVDSAGCSTSSRARPGHGRDSAELDSEYSAGARVLGSSFVAGRGAEGGVGRSAPSHGKFFVFSDEYRDGQVASGSGRQRLWRLCTSASATMTEKKSGRRGRMVDDSIVAGLPTLDRELKLEQELRRETSLPTSRTEQDILLAHYIPVYVMLPLDAVKRENVLSYPELLLCNLRALRAAGVDGVMVDVWWGIVEAGGPKQYDWSAYKALFQQIQSVGLKVQLVMSFHQCGGNTGDSCYIPLPPWILEAGEECPDIYFTNQDGQRNQEYLSFGIDEEPVLKGRTGAQVYYDFMKSFRENMVEFLETGLVTEIEVGLGPAGELRYPSYPETHGWQFPGIGEFQCYDKFLLAQLRHAADSIGQDHWGYRGPHDAGRYNDWPHSTGFFGNHGGFSSDYGRFFLEWYSSVLLRHGDRVLEAAADVFHGCTTKLAAKVAGIHWWYNSKNHAAELAAGYYNLRERDGYRPIAKMLSRHNATLNFTCAEMRNDEQYWEARCGPEGLVQQVLNAGWQEGLEVACENALPRYDVAAFDQIVANARPDGISRDEPPKRRISAFTFLRLCPDLLQERNWSEFVRFVRAMHAGQDYHPEPEAYFRPRSRVRHSKPIQAMAPDEPQTPVASVPLNVASIPLAPEPGSEPFFSPDAPGGGLGVQVGEIPPPLGSSFGAGRMPMDRGLGGGEERATQGGRMRWPSGGASEGGHAGDTSVRGPMEEGAGDQLGSAGGVGSPSSLLDEGYPETGANGPGAGEGDGPARGSAPRGTGGASLLVALAAILAGSAVGAAVTAEALEKIPTT